MGVHRIALVGPSSAFPGGIAQHTAELACRLDEAGLLVEHASWGRQFPRGLRPGGQHAVDSGEKFVRSSGGTRVSHDLHWDRPSSWLRTGRRLRNKAERLVIVVSSPLQLPAIRVLAASFRGRGGPNSARKDVLLIVHNVIPHERSRFDSHLMRRVLRTADRVIVHSAAEAELAHELGAQTVSNVPLPFHPPKGLRVGPHPAGERRLNTLGFLGFVRPYKGLDILIEALAISKSRPRLIVQGEFWEPIERYECLIADLGLVDRIDLRPGYASGSEMSDVLGQVDALMLPYRSATGSQQPRIGFASGVPVITTPAGDLGEQVRDGIDGVIAVSASPASIAKAVDRFYRSEEWLEFRRNVRNLHPKPSWDSWDAYLTALLA